MRLNSLALLAAIAVSCSGGSSTVTGPSNGMPMNGPAGAVTVGNIFFQSAHNGTTNPAIDTVTVGSTVTWTWTNTGAEPHSVQSLSSPGFTSSAPITGDGATYRVTFTNPGTYQYDCIVHPSQMTGTIVVQ